jgi:hypothetical protein
MNSILSAPFGIVARLIRTYCRHLPPGSARWAPPPLRLMEADCEVPVTDADNGRLVKDT